MARVTGSPLDQDIVILVLTDGVEINSPTLIFFAFKLDAKSTVLLLSSDTTNFSHQKTQQQLPQSQH